MARQIGLRHPLDFLTDDMIYQMGGGLRKAQLGQPVDATYVAPRMQPVFGHSEAEQRRLAKEYREQQNKIRNQKAAGTYQSPTEQNINNARYQVGETMKSFGINPLDPKDAAEQAAIMLATEGAGEAIGPAWNRIKKFLTKGPAEKALPEAVGLTRPSVLAPGNDTGFDQMMFERYKNRAPGTRPFGTGEAPYFPEGNIYDPNMTPTMSPTRNPIDKPSNYRGFIAGTPAEFRENARKSVEKMRMEAQGVNPSTWTPVPKNNGQYNEGVYTHNQLPYVLKVENPARVDYLPEKFDYPSFFEKVQHLSDRFGIPFLQSETVNGRRALMMPKIEGESIRKVNPGILRRTPDDAFVDFYSANKQFRNNNAAMDWTGDNILYDKNIKRFKGYDISPIPTTVDPHVQNDWWQPQVLRGIDPKDPIKSANAIRDAIRTKYLDALERNTQKYFSYPNVNIDRLDKYQQLLQDFSAKRSDQIQSLLMKESPYRKGGMITDPMGQWAHPGEVTRIPSNQITMQGVNYPVYGKPNKGKGQLMLPGKEYSYPGADHVTEYPMASGGPSPAKAHEMLRDGTAHGRPLTPAQKRYFGMIYGNSKKQQGGTQIDTLRTPDMISKFTNWRGVPDYVVKKKTTDYTYQDKPEEKGWMDYADDVLSAPQRAATYALTGKYQNPSQALGIKNKWGALAADLVLDPMNLLGVGLFAKGAKEAKVAKQILQETKEAAKSGIDIGLGTSYDKFAGLYQDASKIQDYIKSGKVADIGKANEYIKTLKNFDKAPSYFRNNPTRFYEILPSIFKDAKAGAKATDIAAKVGIPVALVNDVITQGGDQVATPTYKWSFEPHYPTPVTQPAMKQTVTPLSRTQKPVAKTVPQTEPVHTPIPQDTTSREDFLIKDIGKKQTYMLPGSGKKFTYEELIKANPQMKDPNVFYNNYHVVPPVDSTGAYSHLNIGMKQYGGMNDHLSVYPMAMKQGGQPCHECDKMQQGGDSNFPDNMTQPEMKKNNFVDWLKKTSLAKIQQEMDMNPMGHSPEQMQAMREGGNPFNGFTAGTGWLAQTGGMSRDNTGTAPIYTPEFRPQMGDEAHNNTIAYLGNNWLNSDDDLRYRDAMYKDMYGRAMTDEDRRDFRKRAMKDVGTKGGYDPDHVFFGGLVYPHEKTDKYGDLRAEQAVWGTWNQSEPATPMPKFKKQAGGQDTSYVGMTPPLTAIRNLYLAATDPKSKLHASDLLSVMPQTLAAEALSLGAGSAYNNLRYGPGAGAVRTAQDMTNFYKKKGPQKQMGGSHDWQDDPQQQVPFDFSPYDRNFPKPKKYRNNPAGIQNWVPNSGTPYPYAIKNPEVLQQQGAINPFSTVTGTSNETYGVFNKKQPTWWGGNRVNEMDVNINTPNVQHSQPFGPMAPVNNPQVGPPAMDPNYPNYGNTRDAIANTNLQAPEDIITQGSTSRTTTLKGGRKPVSERWWGNPETINAGMEGVTNVANWFGRKKQEKWLRQQTAADNQYGAIRGDRGDYTVNNGYFRPDQMTPVQYAGAAGFRQMGGSADDGIYMSDEEIQQILANGGEIDYLD